SRAKRAPREVDRSLARAGPLAILPASSTSTRLEKGTHRIGLSDFLAACGLGALFPASCRALSVLRRHPLRLALGDPDRGDGRDHHPAAHGRRPGAGAAYPAAAGRGGG